MSEPPWWLGRWSVHRSTGPAGAVRGPLARIRSSIGRVLRPRRASVDARVLVLGTFGTDAVAQRLESVLARRGRAPHAVTVDDEASRDVRAPVETLVVEGGGEPAGVREARDLLGPPDVVVVTAAGRDDLERLGPGRGDVVRSLAAAVPAGGCVVNAEGSPAVQRYLEAAVRRRGGTITHVDGHDADAPGAELAAAIDAALAALEEPPLPEEEHTALVAASRPEWLELPEGRLYDALGVTDVVAIDRLRAALVEDREPVSLVAVLPAERRDVAAALAEYAAKRHRRALLDSVHAVGPLATRFAACCDAPVADHAADAPADAVLATALASAPAVVAGSADGPAGTAFSAAITERIEPSDTARIG